MDHIRTLIPKVLSRHGLKDQVEASLIVYQAQQWIERMLPTLKADLNVKSLKEGVLIIESKHSSASQECHQKKEGLLQYLKEDCGHKVVENIRMTRNK